MSFEIEKKYRLTPERAQDVARRLDQLGAGFEGEDLEENTIFGGQILEQSRAIVRIRRTQRRSLLTFKRRVPDDSDIKRQIEYETEISDPDKAIAIIRELGLSPKLVYEKRRKTWRLDDVEVVIDELPFGHYMEIEGDMQSIRDAETKLEIKDIETEPETYPSLTLRLGKQVDNVVEARFIEPVT